MCSMDDMAAYYPPPPGIHASHYPYFQPSPAASASQPPFGAAPPLPSVVQPQHHPYDHQSSLIPYDLPHTQHVQGFQNDVRTLFIAGLPEDVKPREIYNLFREFPGYESSHLRAPTGTSQPFAFAVFVDQQSAVAALQALNGMQFDLEKDSTLYIDLAKANSRSKRSRTMDYDRSGLDKRIKGSSGFLWGTSDSAGVGSVHTPGMVNSAYNTIGYASTQSSHALAAGETAAVKSNSPPCPTLFVANLGPGCTEQELTQIFSRCPGFLKLKMQSTYGSPLAFVDFRDTASSTAALNHLQGTILYSSPSGEGMRLEYAKSRMGMRKRSK